MISKAEANIEDLYDLPDGAKAEIVDGEIKLMAPTGGDPGYAGDEIFASLREFARKTGRGRAVGDNKAFCVRLPNRKSFSPDAAFYIGPDPGMRFYEGPPMFAVEVRSENDYGPLAESEMRKKRADYFAAGTLIVWDVDLLGEEVIKSYGAGNPAEPTVFRRGEIANADPVLPGWRFNVDNLFSSR